MQNSVEMTGTEPPLQESAQRLRWLFSAFEEQVVRTSAETGITYSVNHSQLAGVFADWLKSHLSQEPACPEDESAYFRFSAGVMLRTLITRKPLNVTSMPRKADPSNPAYFWPEGFLYVMFCLNVRGRVIQHDYDIEQRPSKDLDDVRVWWSFKENVETDSSLAIAFLDHFTGDEPEWLMPGLFRRGHGS